MPTSPFNSESLALLSLTSPSDHSENSIVFIYLLIRSVFIQYTLIIQNSEFYVAFAYTSKNTLLYLSLSPNDSHFLSHPLLSLPPISCNTSPSTCMSFLELDAFIKFYLFREWDGCMPQCAVEVREQRTACESLSSAVGETGNVSSHHLTQNSNTPISLVARTVNFTMPRSSHEF